MVANVNLDSGAVSLLAAYTSSQQQMTKVQDAVSTGYDVNKASDNPLVYLQSQSLRGQASAYTNVITKLTQDKSQLDKLDAGVKNITDMATKIRDVITGLGSAPSNPELQDAVTSITGYLKTIRNLINNSNDSNGFGLGGGAIKFDVSPALAGASPFGTQGTNDYSNTLTLTLPGLNINSVLKLQSTYVKSNPLYVNAQGTTNTSGFITIAEQIRVGANLVNTNYVADLSQATNRAAFLSSVSGWIDNTISQQGAAIGTFADTLDASLQSMQTSQSTLNAEADALTKTDLTADSAKSTALSTQLQLLTSLLSMSNQRMSSVLSLFR